MKLESYLDIVKLREYVTNGLVTAVPHPQLPLLIFCYSRKAVMENQWDEITTKCRGLVVDDKGEIVARPFEKFFNIATTYREETWLSNLPATKPQVLEKLDGSLGILYRFEGYTGIATKGSFASEQALAATKLYDEKHKGANWPLGYTPIFELIVESVQTHVVHYGTDDHLVLTALINNETGEEASYEDLYYWATVNAIEIADIYDKTVGDVVSEDRRNREGYVLTWPRPGQTPLKVKVKHDTFLALQKIAHAATPKHILQTMADGNDELVEEWASETNGEVGAYVRRWASEYRGMYGQTIMSTAHLVKNAEMRYATRKDIAEFFNLPQHKEYAPVAFIMLDRKSREQVSKAAWRVVQNKVEAQQVAAYQDDEEDGDAE